MAWTPILDRARVASVLADIVAAIDDRRDDGGEVHHDDLADLAVVRGYLASDGAIPDDADLGSAALAAAVDQLAAQQASPSLYGGAARLGWTVAHLTSGSDADLVCATIDAALVRELERWTTDYDLISGLVGFGVYALEREADTTTLARGVVTGLEADMAHGWLTAPALLPAHQRAEAPDGYVNLGVAHGLPGVIGMLARFCERGIEPERSRAVLDSALRRVLDGCPRRARGRFPAWQPSAVPPSPRLAWCYGDLGVAAALLRAGLALDHDEARDEGLALALDCAARSFDDAHIIDTGICHGAAGIAHLFNRMAQATGDPALHAAAVTWLDHTLAMRSELPLAGFPANEPVDGATRLVPDASLLTGAGGVALVLHAACSEIEPSWDRLLLVDLPPRT